MQTHGRIMRFHSRKKSLLIGIAVLVIFCPARLSAVEAFAEGTKQSMLEPEKTGFYFTLGPVGMLNTDTLSAPSPIKFSVGFGASIPVNNWFAVAPSLTAFTTYYLWRTDAGVARAYPAEIENRTGLAPSALIELPAVFYARTEKSTFSLGLGVTFFARYAFLADSVPQSEAGNIARINGFFYSGMRFLYPSAYLAYDFTTARGMKAGVMLRAWLPLGSMLENRGIDGGMASAAFRICFAASSQPHNQQEFAD